jgi:hypothetical protein
MRKSGFLFILLSAIVLFDVFLFSHLSSRQKVYEQDQVLMRLVVKELGCSDLAVATEARYTRHAAASDGVVPFMDHPGDIEHFPTGSFWQPVK